MIGRGLEEGWRKNAMEDAWRRNGGGLSVDHLSNTNDNLSTRESEKYGRKTLDGRKTLPLPRAAIYIASDSGRFSEGYL